MSLQYGKYDFNGRPIEPGDLACARALLDTFRGEGEQVFYEGQLGIVCRPFSTTRESHNERQPWITCAGSVITWDGRLDNREELTAGLSEPLGVESTDLEIVAAAYERWGIECLGRLIGDWAISVWDADAHSLFLGRDVIGARQLYYSFIGGQATWSTLLDPLVQDAGHRLALELEYVAGWLAFFPAAHLTPYRDIHAVPPGCYVRLSAESSTTVHYWEFDPHKQTRYRNDVEYEEHFLEVFAQSVRRRLRADRSLVAELSGGMDSSSIVCMADRILRREPGGFCRLDTISYYNDAEPNWNERPYFSAVEQHRGAVGRHIDVGSSEQVVLREKGLGFPASPGSAGRSSRAAQELNAWIDAQDYRVLLSGMGGDEIMGGIPDPIPEFCDLLARRRLRSLAAQITAWAFSQRKPWISLMAETLREFLPEFVRKTPPQRKPAHWLTPDFVGRYSAALRGYDRRLRLFGPLPSFQRCLAVLDGLGRQLGCSVLTPETRCERRYPYLDRDLLEFVFAIPREQLLRPGERRSLMRRSLASILPEAVLSRRRKAAASRSPLLSLVSHYQSSFPPASDFVSVSLGIIDEQAFATAIHEASSGTNVPLFQLSRSLSLEFWLARLARTETIGEQQFLGIAGWACQPQPSLGPPAGSASLRRKHRSSRIAESSAPPQTNPQTNSDL